MEVLARLCGDSKIYRPVWWGKEFLASGLQRQRLKNPVGKVLIAASRVATRQATDYMCKVALNLLTLVFFSSVAAAASVCALATRCEQYVIV